MYQAVFACKVGYENTNLDDHAIMVDPIHIPETHRPNLSIMVPLTVHTGLHHDVTYPYLHKEFADMPAKDWNVL